MTEETNIKPETLIPIRFKKYGLEVGDEDQEIDSTDGFTKAIIYVTAEHSLTLDIGKKALNTIATALGEANELYSSLEEEAQHRLGRPPLQILLEEGIGSYEEIKEHLPSNQYLRAAIFNISVYDASTDLDTTPNLVIETNDGVVNVGTGWNDPDFISAEILVDDETYSTDLHEFSPDLEWVVENWSSLGGEAKHVRRVSESKEDLNTLIDISKDEAEGEIYDSIVSKTKDGGFTCHQIREVEESIVTDEPDQIRTLCGTMISKDSQYIRADVDLGRVGYSTNCKSCENILE